MLQQKKIKVVQRFDLMRFEWNELVLASPDGWTYGLFDWQELILSVDLWKLVDHSFGLRVDGKLVAVVPLQLDMRSMTMGSSGWGGAGPIIDARLVGKARKKIMASALDHSLQLADEHGAAKFSLSISPVTKTSLSAVRGVNPFIFYDLKDQSGVSQIIDLSLSQDSLWEALSADARYQIRNAKNLGMTVDRSDWCARLDTYYELHCETYKRTNVEPHPKEYFFGIAKHMAPNGYSVLWECKSPNGQPIAFHNACWFGEGGCYHTGASNAEAGKSGASYLLFWEAIMGAKASGLRWYDCGAIFPGKSATQKQKGLTIFKTKFGGQPHRLFAAGIDLQIRSHSSMPIDAASSFLDRSKDALTNTIKSIMHFGQHR
jgi:hypothetical protein